MADHGAAERVVAEHRLRHVVVDELRWRVFVHGHLFEHDLALGVDLGETRPHDHLGHQFEGLLEMLVEESAVDDRVLLRCGGVELAAHLIEFARDIERRPPLRALENQVLDEV